MFHHRSLRSAVLTLLLTTTFAVPGMSRIGLASYSITGTGGTVTVGSSGSNGTASPGGISTSSTTVVRYFNGSPMTQVIPTYQVYVPSVTTSSAFVKQPCIVMSLSSSTSSYWQAYQLQQSAQDTWNSLIATYSPCVYRSIGSHSTLSESPAQLVTTFWNNVIQNQLPIPRFQIPPGLALTGLPAYLVSQCTLTKTYHDPTPLGTATIVASGELWVRWAANQAWEGPFNNCGSPWPQGTISHVYQRSGSASVGIKETWSASWDLDHGSGTLTGLVTAPAALELPVRSVTSEIYR